jgi:hypothetical protein
MPCFKPLLAYREPHPDTLTKKNIIIFSPREAARLIPLNLPCGQCIGCRLERSRQWAIRCMHEAQMHKSNTFLTLTYNDESLPENSSLSHEDFQKFMKRLRKRYKNVRYYMCGEYGEEFGRPHFHACLFGMDFKDKQPWKKIRGNQLYISERLQALWPHGFSSIGALNFESAAYVARYIMKKMTGSKAESHYEILNPYGEYVQRKAEYNKMSLKPGIGSAWFQKFHSDVFPSDEIILRGKKMKPPKFYDKLFEISYPSDLEEIKHQRQLKAKMNADDNTPERLSVKAYLQEQKLLQLKRTLK